MTQEIRYANWWSKALFAKSFDNQFVIPVPPPAPIRWTLQGIERLFFSRDFASIKIDRPIFIVGLPRSGTSLLYNILCSHEKSAYVSNVINSFTDAICAIEWARRTFNLNIVGERFLADSVDADFSGPSEPAIFWGKWIGRDAESLYWPEKRLKDFTPEKIAEIRGDIQRMLWCFGKENASEHRFICKYPVFQTELRMIQDLFPDAHFIHIVRDGRPTANSLIKLHKLVNKQIQKIKHPDLKYLVPYPRVPGLQKYIEEFGPEDIRCTANIWQDSIDAVDAIKGELKHYRQIRHEDILADPTHEIAGLFEFCGMAQPSPQNELFKLHMSKVGVLHHKNQYGDYDVVEKIAGRTLKKLGYL